MTNFFGKFSFDYYDLPTIFSNVGVLLRALTININRSYTQPISCICYFAVIFSGVCYSYTYILSTIWFVLVKCIETGDFTSAMVVLSLTLCSITVIPKFCYLKCYSKTVINLVDEYLNCNELVVRGTRFETNILKVLRTIKKQATTAWAVLTINGAAYAMLPFLRPGRHLSEDLFILYGLEPMVESPNYEIASILMTTVVYFTVTMSVHITLFIIVIIGYLEAQMSALSIELTNIWGDSEKFCNFNNNNRIVEKDVARNIFLRNRLRDIVRFQILNMTAGGMAVLNFPSLMFILRSTYSAYTTIKSSA